jgi:hypothetical protein
MIWMCQYRRYDAVSTRDLADRFLLEHDRGRNRPSAIRGWYRSADGQGGAILIETNSADELRSQLEPYGDLVHWEVHAVQEAFYNQVLEELRHAREVEVVGRLEQGVPPPMATADPGGHR